ncbi:MAG: ABC transporter substrate-binding protein [Aeromicrobium sp.]
MAAATLAALTLTACAPRGSDSEAAAGGATGEPVAGDTLTVAMPSPPTSLDPAKNDAAFVSYTLLAYEPLIYRASDGRLRPALATSWSYVGTGNKQLDIELRKDATFADGTPVDAKAVKASLEYVRSSQGSSAQLLSTVKSIDVRGQFSLSVKLSSPNPMLPDVLTQSYGAGQIISPAGLADPAALTAGSKSFGAGAYVLDPSKTVAGDHYTYTANQKYFDKSKQHYKKIEIRVIANSQAALNALTTGQVDAAVGDLTTAQQAKSTGLQIARIPTIWQGLNLIDRSGTVSKPLGDVRVRRAINFAIDRSAISKALLGDNGVPTTQVAVPGGDGYSKKAAEQYPYDPEKARQLLAEAGYADGFELKVLAIKLAGMDAVVQAMVPQLEKVGIKVELTVASDAQTYIAGASDGSFPAVAVGYGAQPVHILGQGLFLPDAPVFNGFHSKDEQLISLYEQAAAAPASKRSELDRAIIERLTDQAWFAPVTFAPVFYYARPDLGGVKVSPDAPVASPLDWYDTK